MPLTRKEISERQKLRNKALGLVNLYNITPEQRADFKAVIDGKAKIVFIKSKCKEV